MEEHHDGDYETFECEEIELLLRAAFLSDVRVQFEGEDASEKQDVWYWFVCPRGYNRWFAYAISDTCDDDDPDESLESSNIDTLKRLAIYLGDPWERIESGCIHCAANTHRENLRSLPFEIFTAIQQKDLSELLDIRIESEWNAFRGFIHDASNGLVLSSN
jgi:hypothetical protein